MLELLENRRLLAASVTMDAGGKLTVKGGSHGFNDIIVVEDAANPGTVSYQMNYGDLVNGAQHFEGTLAGVTSVVIQGRNGGSNLFFKGSTLDAQVQGGSGGDYISVNDTGTGSSNVVGGKGNDVITVVEANNTVVDAGVGDDTIYVNSAAKPIPTVNEDGTTTWSLAPNAVDLANAMTIIKAGDGNDTIILFDGKTTLDGGKGNDVLYDESLGLAQYSAKNVETTITTTPNM
jgi:Ca2+-binding RTX toxin-like protein